LTLFNRKFKSETRHEKCLHKFCSDFIKRENAYISYRKNREDVNGAPLYTEINLKTFLADSRVCFKGNDGSLPGRNLQKLDQPETGNKNILNIKVSIVVK
jgi:hypothetical protein